MIDYPELPTDITDCVNAALAEDVGSGDITASLIPAGTQASARIISRERAVLCGLAWAEEVLHQLDPTARIIWLAAEGSTVQPDQVLATLKGTARTLLTAERCMLNFLQTLSGTASLSQFYAHQVAHTSVRLLDTRKTLPCLRSAQKYAVRIGGCYNHRMGLYDAFLIKENHISACGSITAAIIKAREIAPQKPIEVEVETFVELIEALDAGADIIMLDNFTVTDMAQAVLTSKNHRNKKCRLEASGGINLDTLVGVAETGVDFISIGALTKDVKAIDLSMRLE
jgi:nicotinate-nucleotide pyrophosphorylase (carboxylating)